MKRKETILMAIVAVILGTGMHFVHHAPFFNHFLGCIFPVRESVWEHMKMLFYPLLLSGLWLMFRKRDARAFAGPVLVAVPAMIVQIALFFAYFVFVGHEITPLDVAEYVIVLIPAVMIGARWSEKPAVLRMWPAALILAIGLMLLLGYLSYHYPAWVLFEAM